jgi:hypothetical protein
MQTDPFVFIFFSIHILILVSLRMILLPSYAVLPSTAGPSLPYPRLLLSCAPLLPAVVLPTRSQGDGVVDPSFPRCCGQGGGRTAGHTSPLLHHHRWHLPPLARPSPRPCPRWSLLLLGSRSALARRGVATAVVALRHRGFPRPS